MPQVVLDAEISHVGEHVDEMLNLDYLVLFGVEVPEYIYEFVFTHTASGTTGEIAAGDTLEIDGIPCPILAVGEVANQTLRDLGHASFVFGNEGEELLPGGIRVGVAHVPEIHEGTRVRLLSA